MRVFIFGVFCLIIGAGLGIFADRTAPTDGWIEAYYPLTSTPDGPVLPVVGELPLTPDQIAPFGLETCFPRPMAQEVTDRSWLNRVVEQGGLYPRETLPASPDLSAYPGLIKIEGIRSPGGTDREHCAAARISEHWFLTAAHCIVDNDIETAKPTFDVIAITPSQDDTLAGTQVVSITGAICHAAYGMNRGQYPNDVALFYLEDVSAFEAVDIATLETPDMKLLSTDFGFAYIAGWGKNGGSRFLQGGPVEITEVGEAILTSLRIGPRGPNQGDSGAPLYIDYGKGPVVAGVLSQVSQDADLLGETGLYVRGKAISDWADRAMTICAQDGRYVCELPLDVGPDEGDEIDEG